MNIKNAHKSRYKEQIFESIHTIIKIYKDADNSHLL